MKEQVCARATCAQARRRFVSLCLPLMKEKPKNGTVDLMGAGREAWAPEMDPDAV